MSCLGPLTYLKGLVWEKYALLNCFQKVIFCGCFSYTLITCLKVFLFSTFLCCCFNELQGSKDGWGKLVSVYKGLLHHVQWLSVFTVLLSYIRQCGTIACLHVSWHCIVHNLCPGFSPEGADCIDVWFLWVMGACWYQAGPLSGVDLSPG